MGDISMLFPVIQKLQEITSIYQIKNRIEDLNFTSFIKK